MKMPRSIFEDDHLIVLEKPHDMPTQDSRDSSEVSLQSWARDYFKNSLLECAHRLDKGTSGLVILAKNKSFLTQIQKQFALHQVKKSYQAICLDLENKLNSFHPNHQWEEKNYLKTFQFQNIKKAAICGEKSKQGKLAITQFKFFSLNKEFENLAICALEGTPQTGRYHQLRIQLSHLQLPIWGDSLYGPFDWNNHLKPNRDQKSREHDFSWRKAQEFLLAKSSPRVFLHAKEISFDHPKEKKHLTFCGESLFDLIFNQE
jgi:23S rRNA-/tRNA-specific pseudouridylate synthase